MVFPFQFVAEIKIYLTSVHWKLGKIVTLRLLYVVQISTLRGGSQREALQTSSLYHFRFC